MIDVEAVPLDQACAEAAELAVTAARELGGADVGAHLGVRAEAEHVVTHLVESLLPGYAGWHWAVTIGRAEGFEPTVAEVVLLPGPDAILALPWVPWSERLQPGDLSPGDLLPAPADDPRLIPGYTLSDDAAANEVAFELGLDRVRVLSREGRTEAAERWQEGIGGPNAPMAKLAPAHCGTCGFLVGLGGSLRAAFGVCANEMSDTDGRVVSVEHGCGAHSEAGDGQFGQEHVLVERGAVYEDDAIDVEVSIDGTAEDVDEAAEAITLEPVPAESDSAEPSGPLVPVDQRQAEQSENGAGETGPEPHPVVIRAESRPERDQHQEAESERGGADQHNPAGVD